MNKRIIAGCVVLLLLAAIGTYIYNVKNIKTITQPISYGSSSLTPSNTASAKTALYAKEKSFGQQVKSYIIQKKMNAKYCILIDMRQKSNEERLFLYDIIKDSIIKTGLVAHGTGSERRDKNGDLVFSNIDGSLCTSLGRYKVGVPYKGMWGYSYRLHGLDSTNSNAFKRAVVMHSHACVPNEVPNNNYPICFSYGCPMLSPATLTFLRKYLDKPEKPVLLWIYY
ncbi:MAG: murein L,D-transpeptidase catalytic domain family protein [Ferruginibacter sp.]|nr:murein L,D-transpeptidase catalytic domain family protein [Ferruginibacter sp.]